MNELQLAIRALAQQWSVEARESADPQKRRDLERQIFGLEVLCVRLGLATCEVDLEFAREAINGPLGAA